MCKRRKEGERTETNDLLFEPLLDVVETSDLGREGGLLFLERLQLEADGVVSGGGSFDARDVGRLLLSIDRGHEEERKEKPRMK
jgi:hypothetical protein